MKTLLKKINDTQSTSDTDIFCSEFNSVFDKNIETDTGSASGVTGTETLTLETGAEKPVVTSSPSKTPSLEQVLSVDITTTVNEMGAKISTSDNRVSKAMSNASEGDSSVKTENASASGVTRTEKVTSETGAEKQVVISSPSKTPSPKKVLAITKDIIITVDDRKTSEIWVSKARSNASEGDSSVIKGRTVQCRVQYRTEQRG